MKKFIIRLIFFISPLLFITLFFEVYLRTVNTNYKEKLNGLLVKKNAIELIVFGNSHANYGIDPTQFEIETYNMAMVNQPLLHDYLIAEKYIDSLVNLKAVVICLDYHTLYFSDQGIRNNWVFYDYGIDINLSFKNKFSRFWFGYTPKVSLSMLKFDIKRRAYSYNNNIPTLNYYVEDGVDIRDTIKNGWLGYSGNKKSKFENKVVFKRANTFNQKIGNQIEKSQNIDTLIKMFDLFYNRGIKIYLITMPSSPIFNSFINEESRLKDINELESIIEKFNVSYFDFFHNVQNQDFYYDSDHLNKQGAVFFSKMLNDSIDIKNK